MEIVRFGRREKGQVVARVRVEGGEDGQAEPEPRGGQVRAQQEHAQERRHQVREDVLHRVAVDGRHCDRRRPLVVFLVDQLVQVPVVQQPEHCV